MMENKKTKKIFTRLFISKVIPEIILAILLGVTLFFINGEVNKDFITIKDQFVTALLYSSIMGSAFFSFSTSNRQIKRQISFGITRKKIFHNYLLRIIQVFSWVIVMYLFYIIINFIIIDFLVINQKQSMLETIFDTKNMILILLFFMINMIGFWCGIKRVKIHIYITILVGIFLIVYLLYIFQMDKFFMLGGFILISTVLFFINHKAINKGKIR